MAVFLGLQFSAYQYLTAVQILCLQPFLILGCGLMGAINHNHMHQRIFYSHRLNTLMNFALSWTMGASATQILVTHILVHHRHYKNENDWTRYEIAQGVGFQRVLSYIKNATTNISRERRLFLGDPKNKKWKQLILRERYFLWILAVVFLALAPLHFLLAYLLPWVGGLMVVLVVNFLQHDQLDLQSEHHSRNFLNSVENWLTFNTFYHTIHHESPKLHWTQLPATHFKRDILAEASIVGFLFKEYSLSAWCRRLVANFRNQA